MQAGPALPSGRSVLVPIVRIAARGLLGIAWDAEAELLGFVRCAPGEPGGFLALAPPPGDAPTWSAWLEARPDLLREVRLRLEAVA